MCVTVCIGERVYMCVCACVHACSAVLGGEIMFKVEGEKLLG